MVKRSWWEGSNGGYMNVREKFANGTVEVYDYNGEGGYTGKRTVGEDAFYGFRRITYRSLPLKVKKRLEGA